MVQVMGLVLLESQAARSTDALLLNAIYWRKIVEFLLKMNWLLFLGLTNNDTALILVMTWIQIGNKPLRLPEPMLSKFHDTTFHN